METELAKAIREFIEKATITKEGAEPPGEAEQTTLLHTITDALEAAEDEGKRIAGSGKRGLVSAAKNLAGRAVKIVGGIVEQIRDKAQAFMSSGEDIEDKIAAWAKQYSEVASVTEIHLAVEEAVLDTWKEQGVAEIYWVADEDACELCLGNAKASPIPIGAKFPSGDEAPPGHANCRCTTARG